MIAFMFDKGLEGDEMASREGIQEVGSYEGMRFSRPNGPEIFDYDSVVESEVFEIGQQPGASRILSFSDHLVEAASTKNIIPFSRVSSAAPSRVHSRVSQRRRSSGSKVSSGKRGVNLAFEAAYNHVIVVVSIAILAIALVVSIVASFTGAGVAKTTYVVQPGDTIYSIAARFADGGSVSQLEYRLMQEVRGTVIVPGQSLTVG
jgi:LysM repeat protein